MELSIRNAERKDIKEIQKIAKVTWNHTYKGLIPLEIQNEFLRMAYSDKSMKKRVEKTILLVAEVNNKVVGFANAFTNENNAELSAIYIYPDSQGRGVGTKLLHEVIKELRGFSKITVDVESGNEVGEKYYFAKGFKLVEEFHDDFLGHKLKTKRLLLEI
ncbi:N-acetyltransferase family protein [Bacillus atrophaeus]|uniref:GNAT family N-acetyltransferase n=1 Tax=Bacillus atrophaeus TaxID=1452 RepID=UPI0038739705